jgi:hypothetical protein
MCKGSGVLTIPFGHQVGRHMGHVSRAVYKRVRMHETEKGHVALTGVEFGMMRPLIKPNVCHKPSTRHTADWQSLQWAEKEDGHRA